MESTTYIALSRQAGLRREMTLIANNMANLNTPAYRGEELMFVEYLQDTQRGKLGEMSFTQDISTVRNLQEGPMKRTENPLDLAISGRGYFRVETEEGVRYTRNGSFQLDAEGGLVTKAGDPVLDANGDPIRVPQDAAALEVSEDGTIATEAGTIARIEPVTFENEQALEKRPGGLYEAGEDMAAEPSPEARVMQGMIEGSNVQGVVEMTRLIDVSRSYQGASKVAESEHERMLRAVRSLVGNP
ncbi:flagellar basal-body rod protein FlgF [Rhodovibrio sodomensis]|uniref:Flagellar basal-body rod protein FlgF n=1 Tax=Rhodovibrio sodomensis TaxID=1088 RepID=A0ABS1DGF7_9PROT|nr:flagellar basal-body rod protein FlgF [Rhodovibrio sodomensis]MBK1669549.1 flagellar basal-body rod protein FlgF [Rhodovibrio sodomensis]